ncbi:MAG: hypothetical protein N2508_12110 [Anaerolineae bacterium]|nr:hypothetical protein [Anaerolineae bacterium]
MFRQVIDTSAAPHLTITQCMGNLVVRGMAERQLILQVQGGEEDVSLGLMEDGFTIETRTNGFLTCPPAATLTISAVQGNLRVEDLEGALTISSVYGNVVLREVSSAVLSATFGNLVVYGATGRVEAQMVRGNAHLRRVGGELVVGQVDGNLVVEGLRGGLEAGLVRGNVRLEASFAPGLNYELQANGNLRVRVPAGVGLRLSLCAEEGVRSTIAGLNLERHDGEVSGVLGDGAASLKAQVRGHVLLEPAEVTETGTEGFDVVADIEGLGAQIEASIAAAMAEIEARLAESLGRIDSERIRRHVERATQQALRQTELAMEQARRAAEREAERARLRAEQAERRWQRVSGWAARPRREPPTDEERLQVLRLVESGKITPEQAAELLAALEGR